MDVELQPFDAVRPLSAMSPFSPASTNVDIQEEDETLISLENVRPVERYSALRRQILLRLQYLLTPNVLLGLYYLILLGHFAGWVFFTVYASYCFFTQHSTTQRCKDFEYFSHPKELEVFWQTITGINAIVFVLFTQKLHWANAELFSLKKLIKIPAATVPLLLKLFIAVCYEMVMVIYEDNPSSKAIELGFIWRNICVTSLVLFLNSTFPVREKKWYFYCTLVVFFLDQFIMASLMVGHVHYRITALEATPTLHQETQKYESFKGLISMMTIIGVFTLHTSLLKFFWYKIFKSENNLLQDGVI